MNIILTGGNTGGHFYPLIAIAREIHSLKVKSRIIDVSLTYIADQAFDETLLRNEGIRFIKIVTGKQRRYFSLQNYSDFFKTTYGVARALFLFFLNPPDVVCSTGGYSAFPTLFAARIFHIPTLVYESDSVPGKVNKWSGKFATRIAINFPQTAEHFASDRTAITGHPIRKQLLGGNKDDAYRDLQLSADLPVILILGGSQGAESINDAVLAALPSLLPKYQIIHQCGQRHIENVKGEARIMLEQIDPAYRNRYHPYGLLNEAQLASAAIIAQVAISRSGSGSISEIAAWRIPAILIPLPGSAQNNQQENASYYGHLGGAEVIAQENFSPNILASRIQRIIEDPELQLQMSRGAQQFARPDGARKIAEEILSLGTHE